MIRLIRVALVLVLFLAFPERLAHADCTLPSLGETRPPGTMIYNSNANVVQFCADTFWKSVGGGGGPSNLPDLMDVDNALAPTDGQILLFSSSAGYWQAGDLPFISGGSLVEVDPQVGITTNNNWCRGDGNSVECDQPTAVPSGAIMAFDLVTCPTGWSEYTAARGRFLRGIDNGAGNDPDGTRAAGATQADMAGPHTHSLSYATGFAVAAGGSATVGEIGAGATGSNGTAETRPKNVAVLFCRKN